MTPQPPFKTLVTHGFTLDANERKMSKSEGNVIAPDEIIAGLASSAKAAQPKTSKKFRQIHSLGPDALRLWAASSDWTKDVVISDKVVTSVHNNLDKYRVTFKLLLGMLQDFDADRLVPYDQMSQLDQMALLQLSQAVENVRSFLDDFEFHKAVNSINRWVATDLSGFYFEAIKDIIYCDSTSSLRRRSAQTALYHVFSQMQHMLSAIAPLLVEESFEHSSDGVKRAAEHPLRRIWSALPQVWRNSTIETYIPQVIAINSAVKVAQERARAEKLLGQSLGCEVLICLAKERSISGCISSETFKEILVVSDVQYTTPGDLGAEEDTLVSLTKITDAAGRKQMENAIARLLPDCSWAFTQGLELSSGRHSDIVIIRDPSRDKCSRCWKYEVPRQASQPEDSEQLLLCQRCEDVVAEYGSHGSVS